MSSGTTKDASVSKRVPLVRTIGQHGFGAFLLVVTALLFVVSGHLTQEINLPYFVSYFNTSFSVVYLLVFIVRTSSRAALDTAGSVELASNADSQAPTQKLSARQTIQLGLMFFPIWATMNLLFNWSLSRTSLASNTIISSSSSLFTLGFSWLILRSPLRVLNAAGAAITIAGGALVCYVDAQGATGSDSFVGNMAALVSALLSGLYTTWLKKRIPDDDTVDMSLFFGALGLGNMVVLSPMIMALHASGVEDLALIGMKDAVYILANASVTIVSNYTWGRGIVLTTPLIGVVGLSLTTPIALIDDVFILRKSFSYLYYFGAFVIVVGFLITNWQHYQDDQGDEEVEVTADSNFTLAAEQRA